MKAEAIYIPDNSRLDWAIENLPGRLQRYEDHARYLFHCICTKAWLGDLDHGWACLHSDILHQYIPARALRPLKEALTDLAVLTTQNYSPGHRSTGYAIPPEADGPPLRVVLTDSALVRKRAAWRESYRRDRDLETVPIVEQWRPVLDQTRAALDRLSLAEPAEAVVDHLRDCGKDIDHLRYVCSVIEHKDHDGLVVDPFGFRVHSIATRTASAVRPFLRIDDGPLAEFDVANSQPLLLAAALRRATQPQNPGGGSGGSAPSNMSCAYSICLAPLASVPLKEVDGYTELCENGGFYDFLLARGGFSDRETVKRLLYRDVFFGKPYVQGRMTKVFSEAWPGLFAAIRGLKLEHGYKVLSRLLQRMESGIMIGGACRRLVEKHPEISFLTVHDSALVLATDGQVVRQVIEGEFAKHGVHATVRKKDLATGRQSPSRAPRPCGSSSMGL